MTDKEFKNPKVKLLSFQKDLEILLSEYGYLMDCRLIITPHGIKPQIVVDSPENMKGKPTPQQIAQLIQAKQDNKTGTAQVPPTLPKEDVKQEVPESRPEPKSEGEQGKDKSS